jgi:hypothetical protein
MMQQWHFCMMMLMVTARPGENDAPTAKLRYEAGYPSAVHRRRAAAERSRSEPIIQRVSNAFAKPSYARVSLIWLANTRSDQVLVNARAESNDGALDGEFVI